MPTTGSPNDRFRFQSPQIPFLSPAGPILMAMLGALNYPLNIQEFLEEGGMKCPEVPTNGSQARFRTLTMEFPEFLILGVYRAGRSQSQAGVPLPPLDFAPLRGPKP